MLWVRYSVECLFIPHSQAWATFAALYFEGQYQHSLYVIPETLDNLPGRNTTPIYVDTVFCREKRRQPRWHWRGPQADGRREPIPPHSWLSPRSGQTAPDRPGLSGEIIKWQLAWSSRKLEVWLELLIWAMWLAKNLLITQNLSLSTSCISRTVAMQPTSHSLVLTSQELELLCVTRFCSTIIIDYIIMGSISQYL